MAEVNSPKIEFDKKGSTSRFNLDVNQYADNFYDLKIVGSGGTAYNLTGYGFSGTIRKHVGSSITATDNITVGFDTVGGQPLGIITARVSNSLTTSFQKISPRYTYDIIATEHSSGYKRQLVSGDVNVNLGITQVGGGGTDDSDDVLGANRICIAVIDESNNGDNAPSIAEYNTFRETFPNRKQYLLQPVSTGAASTSELMISALESIYVSGFGTDTSLNGNEIKVHPVNRDAGVAANASDWFDIVGIQTGTITKLALFVDVSGSMTLDTVAASYAKFIGTCTDAGITVRQESNSVEDWLEPFSGILA